MPFARMNLTKFQCGLGRAHVKTYLTIFSKGGTVDFNFIEGMGCISGCIGGPRSLFHKVRNKIDVDKYRHESKEKTIYDAIKHYQD